MRLFTHIAIAALVLIPSLVAPASCRMIFCGGGLQKIIQRFPLSIHSTRRAYLDEDGTERELPVECF